MFPIWLSTPMRDSRSYFVSCAQEGMGSATIAAAPSKSDHFRKLFRCMLSLSRNRNLEIKVKSGHHFACVYVGAGQAKTRARAVLVQPVVFIVPGKTGPAGHKRVVTEGKGIARDIAQVGRCTRGRLLRHADRLIAPNKYELRAVDVMRLNQDAVPARAPRTRR